MGDPEHPGNLLVRGAAGDQDEHFDLARGQAAGAALALATSMPGPRQDGVDGVSGQSSGADLGAKLVTGCPVREAPPIRAGFPHRLEGVGGREDPSGGGDRRARQAAVVPGAIEPLGRERGDGADPAKSRRPGQHPIGVVRVHAHPLRLARCERAGLVQDRGRKAVHAEVVDQRGSSQGCHIARRQAGQLARSRGQAGDSARVAGPRRRPKVREVGHRLERRVELGFGQPCLQPRLADDRGIPVDDVIKPGDHVACCSGEGIHHVGVELLCHARPVPARPLRPGPASDGSLRRCRRRGRVGRSARSAHRRSLRAHLFRPTG